jgi:hypothetical protein
MASGFTAHVSTDSLWVRVNFRQRAVIFSPPLVVGTATGFATAGAGKPLQLLDVVLSEIV